MRTMPKNNKNTRKPAKKKTTKPDLSKDPYFVKKAESAKRLLDQYGTPKL